MEAQDNLNEEQLDDGQAAQILADLNGNDIENQAPINHIDDQDERLHDGQKQSALSDM